MKGSWMDSSDFDDAFSRLKALLRDRIDDNFELKRIYGKYLDYDGEVEVISKRIDGEIQRSRELNRMLSQLIRQGQEPSSGLYSEIELNFVSIRLDIESFFIFTKIFLDTLASIIRFSFGNRLPQRMNMLIGHEKGSELDRAFFEGLESKMSWFKDFKKTRDTIVHELGRIARMIVDGEDLCVVFKSRQANDVQCHIVEYVPKVLRNLSEIILYVCKRF
jgi:hypothetical protein